MLMFFLRAQIPESGVSTPPRIFNSVDLPAPLGPTSPTWSPSWRASVSPSNSGDPPNDLVTASQLRRAGRGIAETAVYICLRAAPPSLVDAPAQRLHAAAPDLAAHPALLRAVRRLRRAPRAGHGGRDGDHGAQPRQGILAVLLQAAVALPLDHHDAVDAGPMGP